MTEEMKNKPADVLPEQIRLRVSRRSLLGGIIATAVVPAFMTKAWAQPGMTQITSPEMPIGFQAPLGAACTPIARFQHASAALGDGRILVAGGWRHSGLPAYVPPLASTQIYDARSNTWALANSLKTARAQHAAVTLADGRVLVVGGVNNAPLASAEIYDPVSDTWTQVAPMAQARYGHAIAAGNGTVVVSGGFSQGPLSSLQIYDVNADAWHLAR